MKTWLAIITFIIANLALQTEAFAGARIAFLEMYDRNGNLVQYEPGGRFVHTALQFDDIGDKWLNAYPGEGVAVITWEQLKKRGVVAEIVEIPQTITLSQINPSWNRPFDFWYSWSDDAIYCTELIGKLLRIPPNPMRFNKQFWPKNYWKLEGTPGLSPDELFHWAQEQTKE